MRQRNDTGTDLLVQGDPPQLVVPGQEIDHDLPVAGLTPVTDEPDQLESDKPAEEPSPRRAAGRMAARERTQP